jgi:cyclophilin family peptidyl-prolyl cis-trans isomerase
MTRVLLVALCLAFAATAMAADPPKKAAAKPAAQAKNVKDAAMKQIDDMIAKAKVDKSAPGWKTQVPMPTVAKFEPGHTYFARMETTKGPVLIQFMPETAPMHVTSFIYLTKLGFYDGISFHRVIPGFMAQGGCPLGNGTGGPGYNFNGEYAANVKHDTPGLLSMANAGPGTDGSQFFLTFVETPWLDGKHTIFGKVVEGMDTLKKLEAVGTPNGRPTEPLAMSKVTIEVR